MIRPLLLLVSAALLLSACVPATQTNHPEARLYSRQSDATADIDAALARAAARDVSVLIVSPQGTLLNADTATTWNDAASRSENAIFSYFDEFE